MRSGLMTLALMTLAFAGCLGGEPELDPNLDSDGDGIPDVEEILNGTDPFVPDVSEPEPYHQVVVAVMDSGVNVYHDFYQRSESIPDHVLQSFTNALDDQPPRRIQLTQSGTYEERLEADKEIWRGISEGELVYFEGTNVLGISFTTDGPSQEENSNQHPVLDDGSHGTGTTTSVLEANPDAIVVLVEGTISPSEQWAATQPWIDILSESYGLYCGQPVLEAIPGDSTAKNNKLAADNGKLVVGAADNTPCPANNDGTAGPPWVVGVAGSHPDGEAECRETSSGNFPDFVADFTQTLSAAGTIDETRTMSGTSFATPTTAGTFSAILQQVRTEWDHEGGIMDGAMAVGPEGERLTAGDLRESMNRTARYFETATPSPSCEQPVAPEQPWLQMGWGHVDGQAIDPAVSFLLGESDPQKPDDAVQYMEAQYQYRQEVWSPFIS